MQRFKTLCAALALLGVAPLGAAEAELGDVIERVSKAYGGEAFTGIRNYSISEKYIAPASGQSWSPTLTDIGRIHQTFVHDLESGRVYFENWFSGRGGLFPAVTIVDGESAHSVDLFNGSHGEAASDDPYVIAGGTMRTTDTLLARELVAAGDKAEHLGSATFMNKVHEKIKIPFPSSPDLTLYVDTETGLINRMTRDNPQLGLLDYVFRDHQTQNGIARATRVDFLVAGDPNLIGAERDISFNQSLSDEQFRLPDGLKPEGERIDDSDMVVNRISAKVYHIGQSGGYTLFVDTGREIVATGGYAGLTGRLARFREETGSHRPLAYQVVTHHHSDHLGGIGEALDLGATLVTVSDNIEPISEAIRRQPESGRFLSVNGRLTLGDDRNRVEIYDISTIHAHSNLLVYLPGERIVFMADHLGSPYRTGTPTANRNTVSIAQAMGPLKLDYSRIATAHSARLFSAKDLRDSVAAFRDDGCPQGHPICPR